MSAWQYAQLTIRLEGRGGEDSCTILWHGPGQGLGENFSDSGQTVLELMNRAGADGWERAGLEERRERRRWPHLLGCRLVPDHLHLQAPGAPVCRRRRAVLVTVPAGPLMRSLKLLGGNPCSW